MDAKFILSNDKDSPLYQRSDRPFSYRLLAKYLDVGSPDSKYDGKIAADVTASEDALKAQAAFLPEFARLGEEGEGLGEGGFVGTFRLCAAVFALSRRRCVLTRVLAVLRWCVWTNGARAKLIEDPGGSGWRQAGLQHVYVFYPLYRCLQHYRFQQVCHRAGSCGRLAPRLHVCTCARALTLRSIRFL